jgi:hypothetical protein
LLIVVFSPAIAVSAGVFLATMAPATLPPPPPSPLLLPLPPHKLLQFLWCTKKLCQPYFHMCLRGVHISQP